MSARRIHIEDADDPQVFDYMNIREAELVKRRGVFLAEGPEVVRTLVLRSSFEARSLLIASNKVSAMRDVLDALPESTPVYVASQAVLDQVLGFHFHRGVIATGKLPGAPLAAPLLRSSAAPQLWVVLEALNNHDNVGSIFRSATAFGASGVLLDSRCADPMYRRSIRVSMGAALRLPFGWFERAETFIPLLREAGVVSIAMTPSGDAELLPQLLRGGRPAPSKVALFLGTEGEGLRAETIAACDHALRIPMVEGMDSINVATSAGIALCAMMLSQKAP